jgi:hypothetical protein
VHLDVDRILSIERGSLQLEAIIIQGQQRALSERLATGEGRRRASASEHRSP